MDNMDKVVYVYENWSSATPALLGRLCINKDKRSETYSFAYEESWLRSSGMCCILDPDLSLYRGRQYTPMDKPLFALFADSCPDRWGRFLCNDMKQ